MKNKYSYIILFGLFISIISCQKREIVSLPTKLATVSNLQYTLTGDTVNLTWNLPPVQDNLSVTVNDGVTSIPLSTKATTFKYGIVETNKEYGFTIKVSDSNGNTSLGQTVRFTRDGASPVKNVSAIQNDNGVLISWSLPDQPVTRIELKIGENTLDLGPTITSYQVNGLQAAKYMISVVTTNSANKVSNTVYLPFKVGATMIGYLGVYADSTALLTNGDDDEIAGGKWLFQNYPKSRYISFDQIKNGSVDLTQIRVIWWNFDVVAGHALPAITTDATVVAKMTQYYKNGGNLLLNQYAIPL